MALQRPRRQNRWHSAMTGAKPADGKHYRTSSTPMPGCQHPCLKNEEGPQVHVSQSMMVTPLRVLSSDLGCGQKPSLPLWFYSLSLGVEKHGLWWVTRKTLVGLQKDVKYKLAIKRNKYGRMLLSLKGPGFFKNDSDKRNRNTVSVCLLYPLGSPGNKLEPTQSGPLRPLEAYIKSGSRSKKKLLIPCYLFGFLWNLL